jgi:TatD DNase family protein
MIDIGANLTHESFSKSIDTVVSRANESGVSHIIVTGACIKSSEDAIILTTQYDSLFSTVGIHPHNAKLFTNEDIDYIKELSKKSNVVAIGECGLDYNRNFSNKNDQIICFNSHIEVAVDLDMPLFLHQRDAHQDMINHLDEYRSRNIKGVLHCFTGGLSELNNYLDRGYYIGVTGWLCDLKRGEALRECIRHLPLDRLLIETDAPYLIPKNLAVMPKNRLNEPSYLPHIVNEIALHKRCSSEEVVTTTRKNSIELFKLPIPIG